MNDDKNTTQVLTAEQFTARLNAGCCPVCWQRGSGHNSLVKRGRVRRDETGKQKFAGFYYECEEHGWTHYNLSPGTNGVGMRETKGASLPQTFVNPAKTGAAGVIRRQKQQPTA